VAGAGPPARTVVKRGITGTSGKAKKYGGKSAVVQILFHKNFLQK
jgi:hypothetical protein